MSRDLVQAGAKVAPPVAVTLAHTVGGLTLNDWLAIATMVYVALQAAFLIWKWVRAARRGQGA